jgi:serine/threonine protein kinase
LAKKNVWPVDTSKEQDWSGRGQHVEFQEHEGEVVDEILQVQDVIGRTNSAIVESVKCRRILLARKTIVCRRRIKKEEVIDEFAILNRLTHSHVVRVIGTYTLGREMSILMYPVAEFDLQDVLYAFEFSEVEESKKNKESEEEDSMIADMAYSALGYFACLSNALDHIHHKLVKHMDIKPRNILVRTVINSSLELQKREYKVYFTDFGISRSYQNSEDVETDGLTNFTRKYAAPEVISQESRGFQADIFSLGCVFLEIFAYLFDYFGRGKNETHPSARQDIQKILATNTSGLSSYYANIARLERYVISNEWTLFLKQHSILSARLSPDTVTLVRQMFSLDPKLRPTAKQLVAQFGVSLCCVLGCETLEATSKEHQDTIPEILYARAGAWVESR